MSACIWPKLKDQFFEDLLSWELQKPSANSALYSQLFAGDVIIWSPGLTTENMMGDNNNDMDSPEGESDRLNQ